MSSTQKEKIPLRFGRRRELNRLFKISNTNKSITLLLGEPGIGKSTILQMFCETLESQSRFVVGVYDKTKVLRTAKLTHPFIIALENLLLRYARTGRISDSIEEPVNRLDNFFKNFVELMKEKKKEMTLALIWDIAEKVGLSNIAKTITEHFEDAKIEKPVTMLAESYVQENKGEAVLSYVGILTSLAEEFKDGNFVLIFDQFESVGKASIDFLIDLLRNMPDRFHVIISLTEESSWEDLADRTLYEYATDHIIGLGVEPIRVEGLCEEEIGEWIKSVKNITLLSNPDLKRIREKSAGFPILLYEWINLPARPDEWIKQARDSEYQNISKTNKMLCSYIIKKRDDLRDEEKDLLDRMSVLAYSLDDINLIDKYLEFTGTKLRHLYPFLERLGKKGLFDEYGSGVWFKHDLIRRCIKDHLPPSLRKKYVGEAAGFYLNLEKNNSGAEHLSYNIKLGCAYLLHEGQLYPDSYIHNKKLAEFALELGDLDHSERCYKRAIDAAEHLEHFDDAKSCTLELTTRVYYLWGRHNDAIQKYDELLEYYSEKSDAQNKALILFHKGLISWDEGKLDEALEFHNESLSIYTDLKDNEGICKTKHQITNIYCTQGKFDAALKNYEENLSDYTDLKDNEGISITKHQGGYIHAMRGKYKEALELYYESLTTNEANMFLREISMDLPPKTGIGSDEIKHQDALKGKAGMDIKGGKFEDELISYTENVSINKHLRLRDRVAGTLHQIGNVYLAQHKHDKALEFYDKSLFISRKSGNNLGIAWTLHQKACVYLAQNKDEEALRLYKESLSLKRQFDDKPGERNSREMIRRLKFKADFMIRH